MAVGITSAEGTVGGSTSASVGAGAVLTATAGTLTIEAGSTQSSYATSNGTSGGVGAGGNSTATATVQNPVSATVNDGATLTAGQDITIASDTTRPATTATVATAATASSPTAIRQAPPRSTTQSNAWLGQDVTATPQAGELYSRGPPHRRRGRAEADAFSAGGAREVRTVRAPTTTLTDPATTTVGSGSRHHGQSGAIEALSATATDANAVANANGEGLGVNSTTTATTTVTSDAETDVDSETPA